MVFYFLLGIVTSCGKRPLKFDTGWSSTVTFPASERARVQILNGVPTCIDGSDFHFLENDGTNWTKRSFSLTVDIPNVTPQSDPASTRIILHDGDADYGNVRDGQFQARIVCCSVEPAIGLRRVFDRSLTLSTKELLGTNTIPTCDIPFPPIWKPLGPPRILPQEGRLGGSLLLGNDIYVAYSVGCGSLYGPNLVASTGPNQAGLLYGNVNGSRWTKLKLLDIDTSWHDVFATRENLYFLAGTGRGLERNLRPGLRSVRLARTMNSIRGSEIVAPHFFPNPSGKYSAVTEDDIIHLTWLDHRHERDHPIRSMLTDTPSLEGNWELYYRSRKDSDSEWKKEILLSKGLDFTYDPDMAVQGKHVVVVFAGYKKDKNRAVARLHPSDIFFTTSFDGGKTWKLPTRITDNAKTGLSSTRPQVVLHNGVIHLFYVAGAFKYQRRVFPND